MLPGFVEITVTDTGIGIAPENISKLFQTFVQIDSSLNRQYAGTGLGLTLVKQIAELHGGCVRVISQVGEGSCFSIILPHMGEIELTKPQNAQNIYVPKSVAQSVPQSKAQPSPAQQLSGDRPDSPLILLVEDNLINIRLYADYLINQGYNLIFAANGQESVEMAIAQVPDLIIMDIQMPILDGFGAIQQIREHLQTRHIPIVALTALAMVGDRERCLAVGADEYLSKPVELTKLATTIEQQLQKSVLLKR